MSRQGPGTDARLSGRVTAVHGRHFRVESGTGIHDCVTRGKKGGIACGDHVEFTATGQETGVIERTLPRRNLLYRSDAFKSKLLAANVDRVFVVLAATPSPDFNLLNRCLIACEMAGIPATLLVNKSDLPQTEALLARLSAYARLGYPLISLAARVDISPLKARLAGDTAIFIGASGVGKSTLINGLVPEAEIATQEISQALDSGRHTTTHTRLYHLPGGGALIDSPGMQEFGLMHVDPARLTAAFPEFKPLIGQCRFYNCKHLQEPGCAILDAVANGSILKERWQNYRTLLEELARKPYPA